ncbi:uncharacterized protein ACOB7L_014402 isoform 1-T1 [Callospermophilus lateralis]|uniref:uncharacterized protein LOC143398602 isoform X1 n=1 Tax=Callospermophilus lateralis TaxID=76772 RepID=UPI004054874E
MLAWPPREGRGGLQAGLRPSPGWTQRCLCCPRPGHHLPQGGPSHTLSACPSASGRPRRSVLCPRAPLRGQPASPMPSPVLSRQGATQVEVGAARAPGRRRVDGHCRGREPPVPVPEVDPADGADSPGMLSGAAVSQSLCSLSAGAHPSPSRSSQCRGHASAVPGVGSGWSSREVPLRERTAGGGWEPLRERDAFDTLFDHAPDKLNLVKKSLITFVNKQLNKLNLEVTELETQFADGVYLVLLMGLLEDYFVPLHNFYLTPESFDQKVHNVSFAFELMLDGGLRRPKARPEDVVNLDLKSTLRVLYNLFTKYKNVE